MEKERASLPEDEIEVSTEYAVSSEYCRTHLIPGTIIELKERMRFCKSPKRLDGAAGWTRFVQIYNRSDRRQLHEVGLRQVGEGTLRTAFRPGSWPTSWLA